jgi:hypothetical protein
MRWLGNCHSGLDPESNTSLSTYNLRFRNKFRITKMVLSLILGQPQIRWL